MTISREDVLRYIEGLSSSELLELAEDIRCRLGLEEPDEAFATAGTVLTGELLDPGYSVWLVSLAGGGRVAALKALRVEWPTLGLEEADAMLKRSPCDLASDLGSDEADQMVERLRAAGLPVERRLVGSSR